MAAGIIIHISVGTEKRTEFFSEERISIGTNEDNDIQIHSNSVEAGETWFELELSEGDYRIVNLNKSLKLTYNNNQPVRRYIAINDGDTISVDLTGINFSFFSLASKSALITTNRETHVAQFIEEAALESAVSPKRDDAKAFLREFVRELSREISWTTKLIVLVLVSAFLGGILYLGSSFNKELKEARKQTAEQNEVVRKLEEKLNQTNDQIGNIKQSNQTVIDIFSLAPRLRSDYGNGVCLIVGVYDLVSKANGKTLRYPDPQAAQPDPYEPMPQEDQVPQVPQQQLGLTTEGNGTPIEYDFIGTGFHVGGGYIITNRHVLQPWGEDDLVKQMMSTSNGRARIKRLVIYFPNIPQPFVLKVRQTGGREDLAIASIDATLLPSDVPVLPLDTGSDAVAVGKTVVSMGYPNGPDRLLAMVDDAEAKSINARFGGSRQALITYLAQSRKIVPLTTQGTITDLDQRRIVHDAKTAEGGSGAPLFGQTGKVIGVNFGVFTESNAANMAIPIRFAVDLLKLAGWKSPEEIQADAQNQTAATNPNTNSNTSVAEKK
ncbi:MAG TPA: trypsin-like peptidase domain-containing protein [Pyrinomonadaceae bacterium]|nr:trypsin-like peptidase domain-containing protein [Pyrinomonadaceae bacterium]